MDTSRLHKVDMDTPKTMSQLDKVIPKGVLVKSVDYDELLIGDGVNVLENLSYYAGQSPLD